MAYSIKYLFKFESAAGTTREIRVLKDGYSGDVIQRPLGRAPMLKKQQNGPVHGTSLEFYAECNVDREFIEFYTSNPKDYRVDLYAGSTLLWQGYITPELYSEPDIAPPYDVQVVATDGVGELKLYDYAAQGTVTLRTLLSGLLSRTGLGTDIYLISSLKPGSAGAGSLLEKTINLDYMAGQTCYEVLTYILDTLHATITWWKGAWILTRETNVTFTNGKVRYFNTAGNSALLNDSVQVLGKMYTNPAWPVGQLSTVIDPAKNKIEVQAPWHPVTCLQNPDMTSDASWTKINSASYDSTNGGYLLPFPQGGTGQIRQQISMAGLRVPMSISVRATASTSTISGQVVAPQLGVLLIYTVGNASYHLRKGSDGAPVWESGALPSGAIPAGTQVDFQQTLSIWDASRIEAEELKVENIPAFMQGGAFPAGTMTVYIIGYCATVFSAHLDVVLPKGYADILHIGNGARGEGNTVEIAIGRETADNAYYAAFLQGLLLDSGSLITSFSDANFTTGMDYLAFIARDYALSVALPRAKVTGTVFLEGSVQIPPLVFTKGGLDYWVETWGWNLYEDELEISARTLPSASLTVQSETILESNGSTVSSSSGSGSSGAGSSMGGGGGTNYWEIDGTLNTLLKPKDAYAYVHSKDGLFFTGATLSGTVVPDLYVDTVNNQRVLRSPLPLITGGDQIVISGTPGGGGGGGGATTLAGLDDTNITNPQAGQMLAWNGTKWVNTNAPTGSITSVSLAAGATNGTLHLVVNGTAQSDVAVTGLKALAYKDSLAFSEITGTASASQIPTLAISKISGLQTALDGKQPLDADLTAIAGLSGTSGFLKKTAANTWSLDSNTYLTGITSTMVTNALGYTPANSTALANYVLKSGDTMTGNLTMGANSVVFNSSHSSTWANPQNSGLRILNTVGQSATGAPGDYHIGLSVSGYYGFQLACYGGAERDTLLFRNTSTGGATNEWVTIWHTGNLTLASLAGDTAKGSTSLPIYYTGSALAPITDLDLLSQSTGNVKANKVYLTSSIYFYTEMVGGTVCVRLNAPFITAGDQIVISGTPGGGGGGGATTLAGLDDVAITSVANGQLLQYNGSKWVNVAASSVGGVTSVAGRTGAITLTTSDITNIETWISGKGYASASSLSNYLPLAGGNMNANALISWGNNDRTDWNTIGTGLMVLSSVSTSSGAPTQYSTGISIKGRYGFQIASQGGEAERFDIRNTSVGTWRTLLHSGNYTDYVNATNFPGLMGNQTITLSGDVSGSGATSITTTIGEGKVTNAMLAGSIENSKLNTIGVSKGGTGLTTWTGAYRLVYSTAATTLTTLAPNSTTTRKFLRQVGANNAATAPAWDTVTKTDVGLSNVENTALSTWAGTTNIATLGTITTGVWHGSAIGNSYLANSSITINGSSTSLGGSFSTASITAGTAGQSGESTGVSFYIPYVTMNAYGIVTAYGTHTHTISASDLTTTIGSTTYAPYHAAGYVKKDGDTMTGTIKWGTTTHNADWTMSDYGIRTWNGYSTSTTLATGAPSNYSIGLSVRGGYQFTLAYEAGGNKLTWRPGGTSNSYRNIWDTGNSNLSTVAWACSTLTASGNATIAGNVGIGTTSPGYKLDVNGAAAFGTSSLTSPICIRRAYDGNVAYVIGSKGSSGADGYTLTISNQTGSGATMTLLNGVLTMSGSIVSTGDQVVSSDLTLKENLTPVTYSVSDIAKARAVEFDWKDGRGHSMGSIAQDWLGIAPALVHGEEGNMSLAYGQLALVNTILEARAIENLQVHESEQDKEIRELRERVERLEMENERLRMN